MARVSVRTRVHTFDAGGETKAGPDQLAGEEPLELTLDGEQFSVTMRTPGHDVELAAGYLLAEGIITRMSQIREMDFSTGLAADGSRNYNVARIRLEPGTWDPAQHARRQVYTSSACGICGTSSIEAVTKLSSHPPMPVPASRGIVTPAQVLALPEAMRAEQKVFEKTGGVHAAALFSLDGDEPALLCVREDVGRHNAVDKVLGWALREELLPLHHTALQVSARASFELVQKAAMAGIPILSAVSAPSAAAIEVGRANNVTVIGFNRGRTFNAYAHPERIRG